MIHTERVVIASIIVCLFAAARIGWVAVAAFALFWVTYHWLTKPRPRSVGKRPRT